MIRILRWIHDRLAVTLGSLPIADVQALQQELQDIRRERDRLQYKLWMHNIPQ